LQHQALETTGEALKSGDFAGTLKSTYKQADLGTFEAELNTSGATSYSLKADKLTKGLTVKVRYDAVLRTGLLCRALIALRM